MITGAIVEAASESVDYVVFRSINGLAGRNAILDALMIGSAKYLPFVFALVLVGLWISWRPRNQQAAFLAGASALIALAVGQVIGKLLPRPRPYLSHAVTQLIPRSLDTSFPSDHAILGFAIAVMIFAFNRRMGIVLLCLAVLMSFARVFVGAHYPGDVIGGSILGAVSSMGLSLLAQRRPIETILTAFFAMLRRFRVAAASEAGR
jgi:undecaprenyl-diphosphatase